MKPTVTV